MSEPTVIAAREGEVIGDAPDRRVEILSDDETVNATWSRFAAGRDGADLHIHYHHVDLFYVLEGELTLRLGLEGKTVAVPAGTLARVPPGVVHGFRNASDADMRYLNLHAPGQGFADYMRGLRDGRPIVYDQHDPPDGGGRTTREAVVGGPEPLGEDATLLVDIEVIAIAELRHAPGAAPLAAHIRPAHVASYYVLDGELALTLDAGELRAPAGAWAQVPAGLEHFVAAGGDEPVRYLGLHTPGAGAADPPARRESALAAAAPAVDTRNPRSDHAPCERRRGPSCGRSGRGRREHATRGRPAPHRATAQDPHAPPVRRQGGGPRSRGTGARARVRVRLRRRALGGAGAREASESRRVRAA